MPDVKINKFRSLSGVWDGHDNVGERYEPACTESVARPRHVLTSWRKFRSERKRHRLPSERRRQAVPVLLCDRAQLPGQEARQSGGVRQHSAPEQQGSGVHRDMPQPACEGAEVKRGQSLSFRCGKAQEDLCRVRQPSESAQSPPVPNQTRGSRRGPKWREKRPCSSEAARTLDDRSKCTSLHKNWQDSTNDVPVVSRTSGVLSLVVAEHGASYDGFNIAKDALTKLGWPDVFHVNHGRSAFCVELFAGTARVTKSLLKRGLLCFPVDICIDPGHNILDVHVQHRILHWIQGRRVRFIWLGIPCTSFTRARKDDGLGPGPIRSSQFVEGLPCLSQSDSQKVREGNALLQVSLRLLIACEQYKVAYALENPASSFIWEMPAMLGFIGSHNVTTVTLDYCQFGEPWKKPTTIIGNYWDLTPLQRRCTTVNKKCSCTQRPHVVLAGRDSCGVFWTLRAQPYPVAFTEAVATQVAIALQS